MPRAVRPAAVGVDGCPAGWVVASASGAVVLRTFAEVLDQTDGPVAVDMPIGLPAEHRRSCDVEARRHLGSRHSTIFPAPPRLLLACSTYAEANSLSRARFGRGLTLQTFHLFAKLRDLDSAITPADEHRVAEAHPECAFLAITGRVLVSKRTPAGREERHAALEALFGPIDLRLSGAKADDVLDAYALVWVAERFGRGEHETFGDGARDERGLLMRIVT